ncbi:MAG: LysR substrate-binding domain-containing protein [Burkholderiaceae bacterium]
MELRHLRYFVAVAEELSFTRAAERLHIGQPPLSQQIQALESEIGAVLLDRTRRWVRLTDAGKLFLEDARRILALSASAAKTANRAHVGELGQLKIGFTRSTPYTPTFPKIINAYRRQFPNVTLVLQELATMRQLSAIHSEALDIGFIRTPEWETPAGLRFSTLSEHPLSVVVPTHHGLARKRRVRIEDVREEEFVMFPRDEGTTLTPQIYRLCADAGFAPKVTMEAREAATVIGLVAAGCGITILPDLFSCMGIKGAVFKLIDSPTAISEYLLASREKEASPVALAFLRVAAEEGKLTVEKHALGGPQDNKIT